MFKTPKHVTIAEFTGHPAEYRAPTWLKQLRRMKGRSSERRRSYEWLWKWVFGTLTTPWLDLPAVNEWCDVLKFVADIKVSHLVVIGRREC